MSTPFIIVGAGQAGLQVAESLRGEGYDGPIALIGDEPHPPYQRPPLSKQLLAGEVGEDRVYLRGEDFFGQRDITLITHTPVKTVHRSTSEIELADGRMMPYLGLALATGARPRTLAIEGADLDGVLLLRTMQDCRRIAEGIAKAEHVVIVGGGFIGLEIAATARKAGKHVVVLEALDRLLARTMAPFASSYFADLHRDRGVELVFGAKVAGFVGKDGHVAGVATADGKVYQADMVVVGVGIVANAELAEEAGIECERGIVVDRHSRTSDPRIVAAGDCTARRLDDGSYLRLESVQNAIEQGKSAAASLLGRDRPFTAAPWFWSDQYDAKLQMAGLSAGHDRIAVRGAPEAHCFSVFYFKGDTLLAVDSVNRPHDYMAARKILDKGLSPTFEQAGDEGFKLVGLVKS